MGLHTGAAQAGASEERAEGYAGYSTLARTQRVMSIAYGGQVLLSNATAELLRDNLPAAITLRDMPALTEGRITPELNAALNDKKNQRAHHAEEIIVLVIAALMVLKPF